jgi:hypothetical protein
MNMPLVLASASFDSTVRLRDMERFRVNFLLFLYRTRDE